MRFGEKSSSHDIFRLRSGNRQLENGATFRERLVRATKKIIDAFRTSKYNRYN